MKAIMSDRITVIRAPRDSTHAYFAISRALAQDSRLTFEARGVLAYLLSKPGDWEIKVTDLQREGNTGRDRTYRILRELRDAGYLHRDCERKDDGTFVWGPYRLYEVPLPENPDMDAPQQEATRPLPENPDMDAPYTAHPYTENQEMDKTSIPHQKATQPYPGYPYTENQEILHNRESTDQRILQKREGAQAPAPAAAAQSIPPGKKPTSDPNQTHPASLIYLELTGYRPAKVNAQRIAQTVTRDEPSLDRWRAVLEAWVSRGNRQHNVDGMLDWYAHGIPGRPTPAAAAVARTPNYETVRAERPKKAVATAEERQRILNGGSA